MMLESHQPLDPLRLAEAAALGVPSQAQGHEGLAERACSLLHALRR